MSLRSTESHFLSERIVAIRCIVFLVPCPRETISETHIILVLSTDEIMRGCFDISNAWI